MVTKCTVASELQNTKNIWTASNSKTALPSELFADPACVVFPDSRSASEAVPGSLSQVFLRSNQIDMNKAVSLW